MIPTELEDAREHFLSDLEHVDFADHQGFSVRWQAVEKQAYQSEDLSQVEQWLRELARDNDRLYEMQARQQQIAAHRPEAAVLLEVLRRVLVMLDDVERRLRQRLGYLQDLLGFFARLVGPGIKGKKKQDEEKKKQEEERAAAAAATKKKEEPKKPTKEKAP
jgi:hypothetical protein